MKYLIEICGISKERLIYLPQHAEDFYADLVGNYQENGVMDFMFAGNIGAVQNIDCILQAAALVQTDKPFCIHIVGDGSELDACKQLAQQLQLENRVIFYGRHPQDDMGKFYKLADCFLLTLRGGDFIGMTLPGKAQGYLSAGRPIVGAIDGAGFEMVKEADCGEVVAAGDAQGLSGKMKQMIEMPEDYREKGINGRRFYEKHYTKQKFIDSLVQILEGTY